MSKKFYVSFEVEKPTEVSDEDFLAWLRFELGATGELRLPNEMEDVELNECAKNIKIKSN